MSRLQKKELVLMVLGFTVKMTKLYQALKELFSFSSDQTAQYLLDSELGMNAYCSAMDLLKDVRLHDFSMNHLTSFDNIFTKTVNANVPISVIDASWNHSTTHRQSSNCAGMHCIQVGEMVDSNLNGIIFFPIFEERIGDRLLSKFAHLRSAQVFAAASNSRYIC